MSTTSLVQQTKTPQREKVAPAVVGPASRDNRHSDSKQRNPSKSRSRPDAKAAWELGLCLSKPEATMQIRPNTERSALSSLWLMSCDHHGSKPAHNTKPNEQKSKKSEANSESRGAVWMLSAKLNLNDNIEDEDNGRSGPPDKKKPFHRRPFDSDARHSHQAGWPSFSSPLPSAPRRRRRSLHSRAGVGVGDHGVPDADSSPGWSPRSPK